MTSSDSPPCTPKQESLYDALMKMQQKMDDLCIQMASQQKKLIQMEIIQGKQPEPSYVQEAA